MNSSSNDLEVVSSKISAMIVYRCNNVDLQKFNGMTEIPKDVCKNEGSIAEAISNVKVTVEFKVKPTVKDDSLGKPGDIIQATITNWQATESNTLCRTTTSRGVITQEPCVIEGRRYIILNSNLYNRVILTAPAHRGVAERFYRDGTYNFIFNNWQGTVKSTGASTPPTWFAVSDRKEQINGTWGETFPTPVPTPYYSPYDNGNAGTTTSPDNTWELTRTIRLH